MISGIIAFMMLSLFSYPKERSSQMLMIGLMLVVMNSFSSERSMFQLRYGKVILLMILVFVVFITWLHYKHVSSEIYTRAALKNRVMRQHPTVLKLLNKTEPDLFPLDETSTPKSWYAGSAFHANGQLGSAKAAYERSVTENPYHIHAWNDLGSVYEQSGDPQQALVAYHHALNINPMFPDALMNIGVTHYNLGDPDSALFYLNRYPFKKRPEYRNNLNVILATSLSRHFSETGDTIRIAEIDSILRADRYYLTDQYRIHHQNVDSLILFVDSPK
jgi:tetratricopeptide (TPR) repeat protein